MRWYGKSGHKNKSPPTAHQKARYTESIGFEPEPIRGLQQEVQENRYRIVAELLEEEKPLLQPPKILRVMVLPYKEEDAELFMTRYVYVKIESSNWILTDLTEQ